MTSEKDLLLRDWELLKDDEQIVRQAATKGKYLNACFKLLAERQEVSLPEARKFFYIHVLLYVHQLLNNRQVHRADHVLKNIGFEAKNVFFEISKESTDSALRDYLIEHCKAAYEEYESHLLFLEEEWMVFNRLKHKKEMLIEEFQEQKLTEFDLTFFDAFCKLDLGLKNKMVVFLFFAEEDITMVPHLDKYKVWEYFVAKEKLHDIKLWTNNVMKPNPTAFEETLSLLYQQWNVDQTMFDMGEQRLTYTETILYGAARSGVFSKNERHDIQKILHRIMTTGSYKANEKFLKSDETQDMILKLLEKRENVQALHVLEPSFLQKVVDSGQETPFRAEIIGLLAIHKLLNDPMTKKSVYDVSKTLSSYVAEKTKSKEMTDDQKVGFFLEHLLDDTPLETLIKENIIPKKFKHLHSFLENAFLPEEPVEIEYLLKRFLHYDVMEIQRKNFDRENNYMPTFNLLNPVDQDIYPTKLSYLHYVKQGRGIYAAYYFFFEHLMQYSKLTTTHSMLAAEHVTEVALQNLGDPNLLTHCISFMENIGIDTQKVRALLRCLKRIDYEKPIALPISEVLQAMFEKLSQEEDICDHVVDLEAMKLISDGKGQEFRKGICDLLSKERSWYKLLLVAQYMNLTVEELFQIVSRFPIDNVRQNLMLAIQYDKVDEFQPRNRSLSRKRKNTYGKQKSDSGNIDKQSISIFHMMHSNQPNSMDLMGAILQLTKTYTPDPTEDPFKGFLKHITADPVTTLSLINYAWYRRWPIFVVLAAVQGIDVSSQYLGIVWLATSIGFEIAGVDYQTFDHFSEDVVNFAVKNGFTETLAITTKIFYQKSAFALLAEFLEASKKNFRKTETIDLLKKYLILLNSEELCPVLFQKRNDGLIFSAKLLLLHIENNFPVPCDQLWILNQICQIGHFDDYVNFTLMRDVLRILDGTELKVSLRIFDRNSDNDENRLEIFSELCSELRQLKLYEKAIKMAKLFNLEIDEIILEYWQVTYEEKDSIFSVEMCEKNLEEFGLEKELLIKFCLSIAQNLPLGDPAKYIWYKNVLDFIQKYSLQHADYVDLQELESQLVISYINTQTYRDLPLYHSPHFRNYVSNENFILYNTLEECKILAGLDEIDQLDPITAPEEINRLNYLINVLLDQGDICQTLRYQKMFNYKSTDLHYTMLCMSLAENKMAPHELAVEERKAMAIDDKIAANKFNRRTLLTARLSQSSGSSSPNKAAYLDSTSDTSGYEFEEIPSREKQAVKEAIQNLAGKVKHGANICRRVVQIYQASMYMDLPYEAVYKRKDPFSILKDAVEQDTLNKLLVVSDIISASKLSAEEVASFISQQLAESIIKSRFYLLNNNGPPLTVKNMLWGFNLDTQFHLFLELCPNTTLFGNYLLLYCEALNIYRQPSIYTERKNPRLNLVITSIQCILEGQILSQKKQNTIQIELLIKAHLCFLYECSMEGIAEVLQKSKALVNVLTNSKSWSLIIKLLTGIGKYKEMFYCFEILIENKQFEALLKQCEENEKGGLKNAIMLYLREYCPNEKRFYELAAIHFGMNKELGDLMFKDAENMVNAINQTCVKCVACHPKSDREPNQLPYIKGTKETNTTLNSAMENYASAAEFYIAAQKLSLAQAATGCAELVALQICLINQGYSRYGSICVLRANGDEKLASYLVNNYLSVPQSLVLSRAINFNIDWPRAIFEQYVMRKDEKYLIDFLDRITFTEAMLDDIFKIFSQDPNPTNEMKSAMNRLLNYHPYSADKYRPSLSIK
ncbi:spatacsin [Culicoides brevitarsis]|uniref:spatacsin n=1 Tax=Culicoides brevitarsis TaxID=469753 RepID=UPI00307C907F